MQIFFYIEYQDYTSLTFIDICKKIIKAQNKDFSSILNNWDSTSSNKEEIKKVEHKQFTLNRRIMNEAVNAPTPNTEEKDKTEKMLNTDLFKIENHLQTLTELHIEFILDTRKY